MSGSSVCTFASQVDAEKPRLKYVRFIDIEDPVQGRIGVL